jgi:TRAP-type C4-dicarboxylate transport system permease small subunit
MKSMAVFERAVDGIGMCVRVLCAVLLAAMVLFTVYTIVMRYVFHNPPFWGDTVSMFCNIWVTMFGYSLAVRDREDIALRGFYNLIPARAAFLLEMTWTLMVLLFGIFLAWFGWVAVREVPGMFWELGGLKKSYPMLVMPLAGVLVALAASKVLIEDTQVLAGRRPHRGAAAGGQEPI